MLDSQANCFIRRIICLHFQTLQSTARFLGSIYIIIMRLYRRGRKVDPLMTMMMMPDDADYEGSILWLSYNSHRLSSCLETIHNQTIR